MLIMFVYAGHIAATWAQADSLDAPRILLKLERVNFLASDSVPNMDWWIFTNLSCYDFGAISRDIKTQNVISVKVKLLTAGSTFLSHGDLFATVELLGVVGSVLNNTECGNHVDSLAFRVVASKSLN